ncbi:MAG: TolC family protein [Bacteroidetes bacterium]|nr:MAG: TolC family protein [Bacteroidota bacterium]
MTSFFDKMPLLMRIVLVILFIVLVGSWSSCTRPPMASETKRPMPKGFDYPTATDTASAATIPWQSFFSDPVLKSLIAKALANNPDLKIATQRIEISRAQLMTAKAALLPNLQGGITLGADRFGRYTMNGVGNFDTNLSSDITKDQRIPEQPYTEMFVGLRSVWEIDIWKKLSNRRKSAAARFLAVQDERKLLQTLLVSETAQLYYTLLALDYELEVLKRNISLQQNELELIKVQKEAGRATELAVKQFSAQLMRTKSLEYEIKQQVVAAENQLNFITGSFPGTIARSGFLDQLKLPAMLSPGLPSSLLTRRPDILFAEKQLVAAGADVDAARAAYLPQLTITPYIGLSAFSPRLLFSPESIAAGALSGFMAPIFMQKQIQAAYEISIANNKMAYLEYEKIVLRSVQEVTTDLMAIENLRNSFRMKEQEIAELKDGLSIAGDLYNAGFATYLEIITAQRNVLDAELQRIVLMNNMLLAAVDLYRSLGGGWE